MVTPKRRFSKPITSRRYLALRHQRAKAKIEAKDPKDDELKPGYKKLVSFDRPGLSGGTYTINVTHNISEEKRDPTGKKPADLHPTINQQFEVLAPRFELPTDVVYSIYPEEGHEATHDTLPHIVFNDCMLPWEQIGSAVAEDSHPDDYDKSRVPWLALLAFSPDELRLEASQMAAIFVPTSVKYPKQTDSMAIQVPMEDLLKFKEDKTGTVLAPFTDYQQATKPDTTLIFPSARLFNGLFAAYDDDMKQQPTPKGGPDISRHRFLAHMMRINTEGMANADKSEEETKREFSVIVANRTGPLDGDAASPMIVHLVSLQNLESLKPFPLPETVTGTDPLQLVRVALVSLYSWTYTCLPPNSLDIKTAFEHLAEGADMLKPSVPSQSRTDAAAQRMVKRLEDGYTVVRSRTATGEETAALFRGALTPNPVPSLKWDIMSNTGSDLNILDPVFGMMDLTYSSAWSLGRTLALADRAFTISLTRVRHQILHPATDGARRQMLQATSRQHYTRDDLVKSLKDLVGKTVDISLTSDKVRWTQPPSSRPPDLSYASIGEFLESELENSASRVAGSIDLSSQHSWTQAASPPYDEMNEPASPDWMVVLRFVLDLYYLFNVPSHYLLSDQSLLPRESLRFFFIDHNWVDALIDGALSLGNQGGSANEPQTEAKDIDDPVRRSIKKAINRLFDDPMCHRPPVPRFGFYLRSAVVAQFPDLKVSVEVTGSKSGDPYLLRHDVIDKETMLGFFSEAPLREGLHGLRFELPAHQQFFSVGSVTASGLEIAYKRQYTVVDPCDSEQNVPIDIIRWPRDGKGKSDDKNDQKVRDQLFVWGNSQGKNDLRLLLVERLATDVQQTLFEKMAVLKSTWYTETKATSAMMANQLNSPCWQLQIGKMKTNNCLGVLEHISPRLSYRRPPQDFRSLDTETILPPKTQNTIPSVQEQASLPALPANSVSSRVVWRLHKPLPRPVVKARSPKPPSSWELVPTDDPCSTDADWDDDFTEATMLPPPLTRAPAKGLEDEEIEDDDSDGGLPAFKYHVSTMDDPGSINIPMLEDKQDLILSIVYEGFGKFFSLMSLIISIPTVCPIDEPPNVLIKTPLPSDANVRMVSNLRFNARLSYSVEKTKLEIRLVPRSRKGRKCGVSMDDWIGKNKNDTGEEVPISERTELSIVLSQVQVMRYKLGEKEEARGCPIQVQAFYPDNKMSAKTVWAGLKRAPDPLLLDRD
ncbi:uncharacterized protein B0J16DRAFT_343441 [Fusarium flagelliforme]|uniref:uncharacterized protein n=1 Tax=Fusarium flagelliforme TaxID=2675880 RepID=UPI001E8D0CD8|nr:uncharacterized protein B0J16DRAFT_343441 [Fusarium flagelliforme]KAH7186286.1 hypothetical protein B0J16DRAFT_343441 [Fusarium flagelliforme]